MKRGYKNQLKGYLFLLPITVIIFTFMLLPFGNGLYLEGKPNYEYHVYDGDFFAPFIGPREDHRVAAAISTSFDRFSWKGFTPVLSYEYSYQFSNVDFYEYDSHDVSLNVRHVF